MAQITTSRGRVATVNGSPTPFLYGSGYGKDKKLQSIADHAAELLADYFGLAIEKRGNSDGHSSGAYHDEDIVFQRCPKCHDAKSLVPRRKGRNVHYTLPGIGSWTSINGRGPIVCLACGTAHSKDACSSVYSQTWFGLGAFLHKGKIVHDALMYVPTEDYKAFCKESRIRPGKWTLEQIAKGKGGTYQQIFKTFPTLAESFEWLKTLGPRFCPPLKKEPR